MNKIIDLIKANKKIAIILAAVIVVLIVVLVISGKGNKNTGFFGVASQLNAEGSYSGTADLNIGGKDIKLNILKNGENYVVSLSAPDAEITLNDLIVKQDGVTYLNTASYSESGGLIALRDATVDKKEKVILSDALLKSLSEMNLKTTPTETGGTITIGSTEEWASFFNAIMTVMTDNLDSLSNNYKEKDAAKALFNELIKYAKTAAETDTIANAFTATLGLSTENEKKVYSGNFELTADFKALPDFIDAEVFDTNQLKITGTFSFTAGETSTAKPTGAIYDANAKNLPEFLPSIWNVIFTKKEYIALNEVTVTSSSVSNKYRLGETIEESMFTFSNNGIVTAQWTITSYNEAIINCYKEKYAPDAEVVFHEMQGFYQIIFYSTENGLASLNKIGKTPNELGEYLKTAKGGEIIV